MTSVKALHLYDHCPFCVRVELALGWMEISYQRIFYGYGDMEGPKKLTGKKILPVLEDSDGNYHAESLDIVEWIQKAYPDKLCLAKQSERKDLKSWFERFQPVSSSLTCPRLCKLTHLKDFSTKEDVEYHHSKYESRNVDLKKLYDDSPKYIKEMNSLLFEFDKNLLQSSKAITGSSYSMDDIIYLPWLRNITVVKGVEFPNKLKEYVTNACREADVQLYTNYAC
ncbi:glutaredoxin 2-like [Zophobas morio]|uniref:glutaredoxin 2-like n=1 Tax=Zophobas morio TaxID=2755281 RepID=UPI003083512B